MDTPAPLARAAALAHLIDAFEDALARDSASDPGLFLPPPGHPLRHEVLGELIRIDLEHAWTGGRPKRLAEYRDRFPAVFETMGVLSEVAFEEYRQRRLHGEATSPEEYRAAYGIDTSEWPTVNVGLDDDTPPAPPGTERVRVALGASVGPSTHDAGPADPADPESVSQWVQGENVLPKPGGEFLGFRLEEELGRGAFGRVYLARQADLGGRPVALKVACDIFGESRTLAQLQHTNIVPIYSVHRAGPLQAVCMPFFGRTTLAQVVRRSAGGRVCRTLGGPAEHGQLRQGEHTPRDPAGPPAESRTRGLGR